MANLSLIVSMKRVLPTAPVVSGGATFVSRSPSKLIGAIGVNGPVRAGPAAASGARQIAQELAIRFVSKCDR